MVFTAILGGCAVPQEHRHYEICHVKSIEMQTDHVHHENYIALCADNAGREGRITFTEAVEVGQVVSFTPYQIDAESDTYHGYIHN